MWLVLQIAGGIVLAYVIIANGAAIWRYSKAAMVTLVGVAALIAIGLALTEAVAYAGETGLIVKILRGIGTVVIAIVALAAMFVAAWSLSQLLKRAFFRSWTPKDGQIIALMMFNFLFATAVISFPPMSEWIKPIDQYSRSIGWADGLPMLVALTIAMWPCAVHALVVYFSRGRDQAIVEP